MMTTELMRKLPGHKKLKDNAGSYTNINQLRKGDNFMPAILAMLLPLIPSAFQHLMNLVNAARSVEGTPPEVKAKLDALSARLQVTAAEVAAVQLPSGN